MTGDEVQALLDRLAERGTVAWWVDEGVPAAPPAPAAPDGSRTPAVPGAEEPPTRLAVDVSGLDSVVRFLVGRGFVADLAGLPSQVTLVHPRAGTVEVRPMAVRGDGTARWPTADGAERSVPAEAFDPVGARPRRLRLTEGREVVPQDDGPDPAAT